MPKKITILSLFYNEISSGQICISFTTHNATKVTNYNFKTIRNTYIDEYTMILLNLEVNRRSNVIIYRTLAALNVVQ